jgi:glutathione S-transferase
MSGSSGIGSESRVIARRSTRRVYILVAMRAWDVASSTAVSVARFGGGYRVQSTAKQPEKLLELYEFEACPFCRKVREALSELDLDAIIYPCPRGGSRFRPEAIAKSGKRMFPFLVDPNTGRSMLESNDIVRYLADTYGDGRVPLGLRFGPLTNASSAFASAFRIGKGRAAKPTKKPEKLLELWSFEASPYCRIAREVLTSLELPYILHNVAKGSSKRAAYIERSGKMQVPYLVDPNTGTSMFESAEIVRYLESTYATGD